MKRSETKILTTHVGSLPRLAPLDRNEGEYTKGGDWLSYLDDRFGGFEERPTPGGTPIMAQGRDRAEFADFYAYAGEKGTLFYLPGTQIAPRGPTGSAPGPLPIAPKRRWRARSTS